MSTTIPQDSFRLEHPIAGLYPASYNPRKIAPDALESLKSSITELGFGKPIICMPDGLIIAGHQRTKAATALGITHVPAYVLGNVEEGDQIRFNQLHNGTDMEEINNPVLVPASESLGYSLVDASLVTCEFRSIGAQVRVNMCRLINVYGPWGCSIATKSGVVVGSPHYAICCKILGVPLRVYYIEDAKKDVALGWLTKQYGEFNYDHIERRSYIQTFAQPMRLRSADAYQDHHDGVFIQGRSLLYEDVVMPRISKKLRILDFGCGQADYVKNCNRMVIASGALSSFFAAATASTQNQSTR